jgi:hypothetical protein
MFAVIIPTQIGEGKYILKRLKKQFYFAVTYLLLDLRFSSTIHREMLPINKISVFSYMGSRIPMTK